MEVCRGQEAQTPRSCHPATYSTVYFMSKKGQNVSQTKCKSNCFFFFSLRDLKIEYLMSLENKGLSDNFLVRQKQLETLTISACNLTSVPSSMLYKVKSSLLYLDLSKNPFTCIKKDDLSVSAKIVSLPRMLLVFIN